MECRARVKSLYFQTHPHCLQEQQPSHRPMLAVYCLCLPHHLITFIQPASLEYGVCQTVRHHSRKLLRTASMQCSRFTRSKSTRATGMVSGSLAISCIPILRHVTFGITTGEVTH